MKRLGKQMAQTIIDLFMMNKHHENGQVQTSVRLPAIAFLVLKTPVIWVRGQVASVWLLHDMPPARRADKSAHTSAPPPPSHRRALPVAQYALTKSMTTQKAVRRAPEPFGHCMRAINVIYFSTYVV